MAANKGRLVWTSYPEAEYGSSTVSYLPWASVYTIRGTDLNAPATRLFAVLPLAGPGADSGVVLIEGLATVPWFAKYVAPWLNPRKSRQ